MALKTRLEEIDEGMSNIEGCPQFPQAVTSLAKVNTRHRRAE
jgi:hypothetical protein